MSVRIVVEMAAEQSLLETSHKRFVLLIGAELLEIIAEKFLEPARA